MRRAAVFVAAAFGLQMLQPADVQPRPARGRSELAADYQYRHPTARALPEIIPATLQEIIPKTIAEAIQKEIAKAIAQAIAAIILATILIEYSSQGG